MAREAPAHLQAELAAHTLHRLDGAVALLALEIRQHVPAMIKVDEVREVIDLVPADRFLFFSMFQ